MTMNRSTAVFIAIPGASWLLFVTAVYVPDSGRGFVKDDFGWVEAGRAALHSPADPLAGPRAGFYRPIVDFSFAIDYLVHDTRPRGYGFAWHPSSIRVIAGCSPHAPRGLPAATR